MTNPFASIQEELKIVRSTIEKERTAIHVANRKSLQYYTPTKKEIYEALLKNRPETPTQEEVEQLDKKHPITTLITNQSLEEDKIKEYKQNDQIGNLKEDQQGNKESLIKKVKNEEKNKKEQNKTLIDAVLHERMEDIKQSLKTTPSSVNELNEQKQTPIMIAAQKGNIYILALLIRAGGDVNLMDNNGNTAIHVAIQEEHELCVAMLLATPLIDYTLTNNKGESPLSLSIANGNDVIQCMLIAAGVSYMEGMLDPYASLLRLLETPKKKTITPTTKLLRSFIADVSHHQLRSILLLVVHNAHDTLCDFKTKHMLLYESYVHDIEHLKKQNDDLTAQNLKLKHVVRDLMDTMSKAAAQQDVEVAQYEATILKLKNKQHDN